MPNAQRIKLLEGDVFSVPLTTGGTAVGVAVRVSRRGGMLAYLFPNAAGKPSEAILVARVSGVGVQDGEWPILGSLPDWQREDWPMPAFGHVDVINPNKAWRRVYDENDVHRMLTESPITPGEARELPPDRFAGHRALEKRMTRLLSASGDGLIPTSVPVAGSAAVREHAGGTSNITSAADAEVSQLFDDDVAADARAIFQDALSTSATPEPAAAEVQKQCGEAWNDLDDGPALRLAVAVLLHDNGVLDHPIIKEARDILEQGVGLERYERQDALQERQALYTQLSKRLGDRK